MNKRLLATALTLALSASFAQAADLVPINFDGVDEGYNDPTAATPVGGNPGTTIGEQRQIVAQFAADLWGSVLNSSQPVYIAAQFNPLGANVLGSAGSPSAFLGFPGAAAPNLLYGSALADALSGVDQNPGYTDINSQFSSDFSFYYGLDGKTPVGQINFLDVVMHEFGHGLGFQNFENEATGGFLAGYPDIYSTFTYDNTVGKRWTQMTSAERRASALTNGNVIFDAAHAVAGAALVLDPRIAFRLTAPAAIAGSYAFGTASFGPNPSPANFSGSVVIGLDAADAAGASTFDGCSPLTNPAAVAGHVAIISRGTCGFVVKVKNAQNAGATAVIIADNAPGAPAGLGGADPSITIPAVRLSLADSNTIKANLPGVQASIYIPDPTKLQGADNAGRPRLYMPIVVEPGSSGSHYDTAMLPNALMEPAINSTLNGAMNLDITPNLLQDTGWTLTAGNAKLDGCDTGIDLVNDGGIIVGANVQATSNLCLSKATTRGSYQGCMDTYKDRLLASGLVTGKQAGKMMSCAAKVGK
jgi:hypothetical protein